MKLVNGRDYKHRRQLLEKELGYTPIVLTAYVAMQLSGDMAAPFRQESSFLYLTGLAEPDWLLIINKESSYLVEPSLSASSRLFDGDVNRDEVLKVSGVDGILSRKQANELLRQLAKESKTVYTLGSSLHEKYYNFAKNPSQSRLTRRLRGLFEVIKDCRPVVDRFRAIKSDQEISLIDEATKVSHQAFSEVHKSLKRLQYEYEIEAYLSAEFRKRGADGHAYAPIVAGGKNALTLHYIKNNDVLPKNGLVLIDAGAAVDGYASDITRTYSIGEPSEDERAVHEVVEKAEKDIIKLVRPGLAFDRYHSEVDKIMQSALSSLGLLSHASDYRRYFPHAISHGIGLDVHESLGGYAEFKDGMVLTVEPGIYIPETSIGVRIEDTIVVTGGGSRILGEQLPTAL